MLYYNGSRFPTGSKSPSSRHVDSIIARLFNALLHRPRMSINQRRFLEFRRFPETRNDFFFIPLIFPSDLFLRIRKRLKRLRIPTNFRITKRPNRHWGPLRQRKMLENPSERREIPFREGENIRGSLGFHSGATFFPSKKNAREPLGFIIRT